MMQITLLLLHQLENGKGIELPNVLAFKWCASYMGNFKTIFTNKFLEIYLTVIFHKEHARKILTEV